MTINAYEKLKNKIEELLPNSDAVSSKFYEHESAIELFYRFPYFSNVKKLLRQYNHQYLQYAIDSYTYPNGLIRLESYCVLNGEYAINQTIITDNLECNNAIVHIWNKYELKSLPQFFIKSESANSIFGFPCSRNEERNIETNETEIEIDNMVIGRFTRISKDNSSTVYAEKYMPINMISDWNLELKDIFSNVELEILYRYNDFPVFAQLLDDKGKSLLEETQYCPNDYTDAKIFVESVINEVDEIVKEITKIIGEYGKSVKEKKSDENNLIEEQNEIASMLTREKSMELIANREQIIQEKMRKIEEEEYQSEVAIMEENEDYDDDNWNMILGSGGQSNSLRSSNVQEKVLVRKRTDNNETSK